LLFTLLYLMYIYVCLAYKIIIIYILIMVKLVFDLTFNKKMTGTF